MIITLILLIISILLLVALAIPIAIIESLIWAGLALIVLFVFYIFWLLGKIIIKIINNLRGR